MHQKRKVRTESWDLRCVDELLEKDKTFALIVLMKPTFIGIGAPKCGSTWLTEVLRAHPQVFVPETKETMFFGYRYTGAIEDYEKYFAGAVDKKAAGEFCTIYFSDEQAPYRIHSHYPNGKLILVLRDPVEQLYSHYWHLASQNFHANTRQHVSLEDAIRQYPERLLRPALYGQNLARWLGIFYRRQILVLYFDDIKSKPGKVAERLYRFLEVESGFQPPIVIEGSKKLRPGVSPRNRTAELLHRHVYHALKVKIFDPLCARIGTERAWRWKDALKVREVLNALFMSHGYLPMDPVSRESLRARLRPEILEVERLLNVDLSTWKVE